MSQDIWSSINPQQTSGIMLAAILTDFKDAVTSGFSGEERPENLQAGGMWIDTSNQAAPDYYWAFMFYTGSEDVEIFRISVLNGIGGTLTANSDFTVREVADDSIGAILQLVKNRDLDTDNGQVLDGDTVYELKFVGRTNTATDPTVAYFKFTATDDMETANYGGTWTMYSTPDGTSTITEHLKFIGGLVETAAKLKVNSLRLVADPVATTATIAQLDATNALVEMTGSTDTDIQGINSDSDTKEITIHNRSTATVTIKHQNGSAAEADRIKLPNGNDHILIPDDSATFIYSTTDARWKLKSATVRKLTKITESLNGAYQQWTAPDAVSIIKITGHYPHNSRLFKNFFLDPNGNLYTWGSSAANANGDMGTGDVATKSSPVAVVGGIKFLPFSREAINGGVGQGGLASDGTIYMWGFNNVGQLGVGDVTKRSSPVAVVGGLKFSALTIGALSNYGITESGYAYAWGSNAAGELGVGDVTPRSSPVAVLGGLRFSRLLYGPNDFLCVGITRQGVAYSWGYNPEGQLGVGDVAARSSPVAVLGGLTFKKIVVSLDSSNNLVLVGLTTSGALYAWGSNTNGQLGVGDVIPRSSPVAVLGGLTFSDVAASAMGYSIFGLSEDGDLYAWGYNADGQLGLGDVIPRSSPVAVLGGLSFKQFIPSNTHCFGLTETGALYAWGGNLAGQLGVGDTTSRSSPVAVLGGITWGEIEAWRSTTFGSSVHGTTYAWGDAQGVMFIGDGDTANRSSPVAQLGGIGSMTNRPAIYKQIEVVPGQTYDVVLSQGQSYFGDIPIGLNIDHITIEYDI